MLDQIGGCFAPQTLARRPPHSASFAKALTYFASEVSDVDILTLYALRCAFAHDYALTNIGKTDPRLTHRFLLVDDLAAPLVEYPVIVWSGRWKDRSRSNQTRVHLRLVGDVAESAVERIAQLHANNELVVVLHGGIDELLARFTLQERP